MDKPILFDGAFGTYYYRKTGDANPCELANLDNPRAVLEIHREYIAAGADAIKTNTFASNPANYDGGKLSAILAKGYETALAAARGTAAAVYADIGNIACEDPADLPGMYERAARVFIGLGAENFLFETLAEFEPVIPALEAIGRAVQNPRVLVSFAVSQDGYTQKGLYYKALIGLAAAHPAVSFTGLNCVCGPTHLLHLVKELGKTAKSLSVMPNSGYPSTLNGRLIFEDNARYFAEKIRQLYDSGAQILGGCCGTTPLHIELSRAELSKSAAGPGAIARDKPAGPGPAKKSAGRLKPKPLFIEIQPPTDSAGDFLDFARDQISRVRESVSGADCAFTFTDSPLAKARADSMMTAARLRAETGADVMPHLTCRDKNHIAIKAALLGAAMFGIGEILAVTGDPIFNSPQKKAGVFDFNSLELIAYLNSLNREVFPRHPFVIGAALNVNARNFAAELERGRKKAENGARRLFTQPICSPEAIQNFKTARRELDCELIAGVLPFAGYKNALFLNNEVAGITIPQSVIDAIRDKPPQEVYDISVEFCAGIIAEVYEHADGFYITTPLKKTELTLKLITSCFDF